MPEDTALRHVLAPQDCKRFGLSAMLQCLQYIDASVSSMTRYVFALNVKWHELSARSTVRVGVVPGLEFVAFLSRGSTDACSRFPYGQTLLAPPRYQSVPLYALPRIRALGSVEQHCCVFFGHFSTRDHCQASLLWGPSGLVVHGFCSTLLIYAFQKRRCLQALCCGW